MSLIEAEFSGKWWEIARYGGDEDIFQVGNKAVWYFDLKRSGYYSLRLDLQRDDTIIYRGYATVCGNKLNIAVYVADILPLDLGEYIIFFTDYKRFAFIGKEGEVIVLCRENQIDASEIKFIIATTEKAGYDGSKIIAREDVIREPISTPQEVILTEKKRIRTKPVIVEESRSTKPTSIIEKREIIHSKRVTESNITPFVSEKIKTSPLYPQKIT